MIRCLVALVLALSGNMGVAGSNADREAQCRYQYANGQAGWTDREVKKLIACAVSRYPVSGGLDKALYIANRESGFECRANNPNSSAFGVYQVISSTWTSWHAGLPPRWWHRRWELMHSRGNCRANVMVSIRIAHSGGWGPWGM